MRDETIFHLLMKDETIFHLLMKDESSMTRGMVRTSGSWTGRFGILQEDLLSRLFNHPTTHSAHMISLSIANFATEKPERMDIHHVSLALFLS
jgi:hypothetical protein